MKQPEERQQGRRAHAKVTVEHQKRKAYVYIRQSTLQQVAHNQESQVNQRQMVERARELGWSREQIEVIDEDQGLSGSESAQRNGFQHIVAEVCLGQVGIVVGYEVSRLARNNRDWYHLLDLTAMFDTLIADNDGVYDPRLFNDRLLLGLKGTMSEAELHLLKQRLQAGRMRQVERGTYRQHLPTGLVRLEDGSVVKDANVQVQHSIALVLNKFAELGSCGQVLRYLRREELTLPRRQMRGPDKGTVVWKAATYTAVHEIVRNPAYAGAFVYGRKQQEPRRVGGPNSGRERKAQEEWLKIQQDVYPAYITWEQYQANQEQLKKNRMWFRGAEAGAQGAQREGRALLQGLALCGHCGYQRQVNYKKRSHNYQCLGLFKHHGRPACPLIHGPTVDEAVTQVFFAALQPAQLNTLQDVLAAQRAEQEQLAQEWDMRVQQAEYQAQLAQRQYMQVEPENRLVAAELERRWENKLEQLQNVQQAAQRCQQRTAATAQVTAEMQEQFERLSEHLPQVWERIAPVERKTLLRSLIDSVILKREAADCVSIRVVWVSGYYTALEVLVPTNRREAVSGYEDMVRRIGELYTTGLDDVQIAAQLSQEGFHSARRSDVALDAVKKIRQAQGWHHNTGPQPVIEIAGRLTVTGLAQRLGVDRPWVYRRLRNGTIGARYVTRDSQTHRYLIQDVPELIARLQALVKRT
jgi:DNA invertase Pin-like site-specific DNA recombinase